MVGTWHMVWGRGGGGCYSKGVDYFGSEQDIIVLGLLLYIQLNGLSDVA
jgi:hypothetical protein